MKTTQKRKQRKAHFTAPLHKRQKKIAAPLSKELRKTMGKRSTAVCKEDTVKIVRGQFAGVSGKVKLVSLRKYRIHVEGAVQKNAKGENAFYPIHPSNVMITELKPEDKKRAKKK